MVTQADQATTDHTGSFDSCYEDTPRDVFVLGAGFSIAVCDQFPTTDKLGNRVIKRFRAQGKLEAHDLRLIPAD